MMALPLYASLLAGWMVVSVTALLVTEASLALRGLLAGLLLVLCGVAGGSLAPTTAQGLMEMGPALALCVHVAWGGQVGGGRRGTAVLAFILAGSAALAVAFGRCDGLFVAIGGGLAVRLGLAHGPRGLDRAGWQALRTGLGGLVMAQGGLSVLQAQWGGMADQAGAVLLAGGVLLACGTLADPVVDDPLAHEMNTLAALPVMAHAAGIWPALQPALTALGLVCLLWSALPRGEGREPAIAWGAWAVLAAGMPGGGAMLPLAACLLAVACTQAGMTAMPDETAPPWPPFLPGVALVLVLVGLMEQSVAVAVLAAISLWPVMRRSRAAVAGQGMGMRGMLSLGLGGMVLAAFIHQGWVGS